MAGLVPGGRDQPLWWTLRRPFRALAYDAARAMFTRAGAALGANWSLHDLRHSAAYRMARDPAMPLADLQWVMGHAHLSTTQRYLNPLPGDVIEAVLAFHVRQRERGPATRPAAGIPGREPDDAVRQGRAVTAAGLPPAAGAVTVPPAAGIPQPVSGAAAELLARFPPRPAAGSWPATRAARQEVLARLLAPPFPLDNPLGQQGRRLGLISVVGLAGGSARRQLAGPVAGQRRRRRA